MNEEIRTVYVHLVSVWCGEKTMQSGWDWKPNPHKRLCSKIGFERGSGWEETKKKAT